MTDDATRSHAAKRKLGPPSTDTPMTYQELAGEFERQTAHVTRIDPHSADWKDGYDTGFAEGASGDFNPDGSYKKPPATPDRAAEQTIEKLRNALLDLCDLHHRTLTGSAKHNPARVSSIHECECLSCRRVSAVLRETEQT